MNISFIGFGEAAYYISLGLFEEGIDRINAFDANVDHKTMGKLIRTRAQESGIELLASPEQAVEGAHIIICAVPSSIATTICTQVKSVLGPGQIYVDVSASTPIAKRQCCSMLRDTGALFVDAAMLGSLPKDRHRVPISASGDGAALFKEWMEPYGMQIKLEGRMAGDASAIKLVRSIFMKGISALMIETLEAASSYGITKEVLASIGQSMDNIPFVKHLDRLVIGSALHSVRRANELKGSAAIIEEAGLTPEMTNAARRCLERLAPFRFAERYVDTPPSGWQDIIEVLKTGKGGAL